MLRLFPCFCFVALLVCLVNNAARAGGGVVVCVFGCAWCPGVIGLLFG